VSHLSGGVLLPTNGSLCTLIPSPSRFSDLYRVIETLPLETGGQVHTHTQSTINRGMQELPATFDIWFFGMHFEICQRGACLCQYLLHHHDVLRHGWHSTLVCICMMPANKATRSSLSVICTFIMFRIASTLLPTQSTP